MARRRRRVLAGFEAREPRVYLGAGRVAAIGVVLAPGLESIRAEFLARFLTDDVLGDGLAHEPVGRAAAGQGETAQAVVQFGVQLEAGRVARGAGQAENSWCYRVLPYSARVSVAAMRGAHSTGSVSPAT